MSRCAVILLTIFLASPLQAGVLYQNNFDGPVVVAAGVTASLGGSFGTDSAPTSFSQWSGQFLINQSAGNPASATTWTFTNLPGHSSISMKFLLGFLDSWDSTDGSSGFAPDFLDVFVDGNPVAQMTANNGSGNVNNFAGGALVASGVQASSNNFFSDKIVDMSTAPFMSFAHTASTLTLSIQAGGSGWQGGTDESWGIDAIDISYAPTVSSVPEPNSLVVVSLLGFVGCAFARFRRDRKLA